jgi:hypothetical protein
MRKKKVLPRTAAGFRDGLYELLTGRPRFQPDTPFGTLLTHRSKFANDAPFVSKDQCFGAARAMRIITSLLAGILLIGCQAPFTNPTDAVVSSHVIGTSDLSNASKSEEALRERLVGRTKEQAVGILEADGYTCLGEHYTLLDRLLQLPDRLRCEPVIEFICVAKFEKGTPQETAILVSENGFAREIRLFSKQP